MKVPLTLNRSRRFHVFDGEVTSECPHKPTRLNLVFSAR